MWVELARYGNRDDRRKSTTIVKTRSVSRVGTLFVNVSGGHRHTVLSTTTTRKPLLSAEPSLKIGADAG